MWRRHVAGLLILGTLVILLTGGTFFQPRTKLYLYVPDGTGIGQGAPVRVDGIQVGKVEDVALSGATQPNRVVRVTMTVARDQLSSIPADSTAQPAAETLVGDMFIQISSGQSHQHVQPGTEIAYEGAPDLVQSLDLSQFRKSLQQMDALLTDIENGRNRLGQFIMTDDFYRELIRRVGEVEHSVQSLSSTTNAFGRELYSDTLYQRIAAPIQHLDDTLARLQSGQGGAGQFLQDNAQYDKLYSQIATLRKSVEDVHTSPFMTSSASYDDWNRTLQTLIREVDEFSVSPLMATGSVYENLNGVAKELQQNVREFRQHPQKFLRLKLF